MYEMTAVGLWSQVDSHVGPVGGKCLGAPGVTGRWLPDFSKKTEDKVGSFSNLYVARSLVFKSLSLFKKKKETAEGEKLSKVFGFYEQIHQISVFSGFKQISTYEKNRCLISDPSGFYGEFNKLQLSLNKK